MTWVLEELPGKGLLPVLCRMFCLALMKARMSESVWLSPVRGTDDTGLSGMLGTRTHHTLPCLTFGPRIHLSRALFRAHGFSALTPASLQPPQQAACTHARHVVPGLLAQTLHGFSSALG